MQWVTVVFPLVPVTPTTAIRREGSPWTWAAMAPIATLVSSTTIWGTGALTSCSTARAGAPASTAAPTKS